MRSNISITAMIEYDPRKRAIAATIILAPKPERRCPRVRLSILRLLMVGKPYDKGRPVASDLFPSARTVATLGCLMRSAAASDAGEAKVLVAGCDVRAVVPFEVGQFGVGHGSSPCWFTHLTAQVL